MGVGKKFLVTFGPKSGKLPIKIINFAKDLKDKIYAKTLYYTIHT